MKYNDFQFPTGAISVVAQTSRDKAIHLALNTLLKDGRKGRILGYEYALKGYARRYFDGKFPELTDSMKEDTLRYADVHNIDCEDIVRGIPMQKKKGIGLFFIDTLMWMPMREVDTTQRPDIMVEKLMRLAIEEDISIVVTDTYPERFYPERDFHELSPEDLHNGYIFGPMSNLILAGKDVDETIEVRAIKSRDVAPFSWTLKKAENSKALVLA